MSTLPESRSDQHTRILRISGIIEQSIVDGPGLRFVVFTQGCPHHCVGCHNPDTHSFQGGFGYTLEKLLELFDQNPILSGMTFSGGEPLAQAAVLAPLASAIKARGKDIWCYTGYTFEEALAASHENGALRCLLPHIDVMVDGRFDLNRKSASLPYRGSTNQRMVRISESLTKGTTILL